MFFGLFKKKKSDPTPDNAKSDSKNSSFPLLLDDQNRNKDYREQYRSGDFAFIENYFYDYYENKLEHFSDKVDSIIDNISDRVEHPDKTLLRFDSALTYLNEKIYPFFEEKRKCYGDKILSEYQEYVQTVQKAKQDFITYDYEEQLADYNEMVLEKAKEKEATKMILSFLRKSSPAKRVDLLRQFSKEDLPYAKDALNTLVTKKKVIIGRPEGKTTGPLYVSLPVK